MGQLTWFDRAGKVLGTAGEPGVFLLSIKLSRDASKVAMSRSQERNTDIWIFEFSHGVSTRFTFDPAADVSPVWSPDDSRIGFTSFRGGKVDFYQKAADGSGREELRSSPSSGPHYRTPQAAGSHGSRTQRFRWLVSG